VADWYPEQGIEDIEAKATGKPMQDASPEMMSLFCGLLECSSAQERAAYLDAACGTDTELRARLAALLQAHEQAGNFLAEKPAIGDPSAIGEEPRLTEMPGTVIGPYKLLEQIGEGGFGVVFMAAQQQPVQRKVALKVLKPGMDTKQVIARFEAERQALALMDHPHIAHVFDGGETTSGRPYFVMELVKGIPITDYCDQSHLTANERLELFIHVCQAVQHAHQKGIIHRDLKPSNILVTLRDSRPMAKVIDFGIAKASGQELTDKTLFTGFGQLIGTPLYMSPEQAALSHADVDTRSDIYSLGVLLYELLTSTTPFEKERLKTAGYDEMRRIIREEEPPKPSTRISTLGQAATTISAQRKSNPKRLSQLMRGELDWIVMKALEKDRNRRYETASAFAADVQRYLHDEPVQACPPSAAYRLRKFVRRNRGPVLAAGLLLAALVVGIAGTGWGLVRAEWAKGDALAAAQSEKKAKETALAKEAESRAVLDFVQNQIFATARPLGQQGGLGREVTLRQAMEAALPVLDKSFTNQPVIEARLRMTVGDSFLYLGEAQIAADQYRRARALYTEHLGAEHPDTLKSMYALATSYRELGRHTDALALCLETLALQKAKLGPNDAETLTTMNKLGVVYISLGRFADAVKVLEETLALRRAKLGPDHNDTLLSMQYLANAYDGVDRYDDALTLREQTLAARKVKDGPRASATLFCMGNLTLSYTNVGRYNDALKLQEETLALAKDLLGPTHSDTISCMGNLGHSYEAMGRHADALQLRQETLVLRKARSGPDHQYTFRSMHNLATSYYSVGRYADAIKLHQEVLALQQAKLPVNHPDTLQSMWSLANCYTAVNRRADALKLYEETLALRRANFGSDHSGTVEVMRSLARLRLDMHEDAAAEALLVEALALAAKRQAAKPLESADIQALLGDCLLRRGEFGRAEIALRACLATREQKDPDRWPTSWSKSLLGAALLGQKKYADAESLLLAGYEGLSERQTQIAAPDRSVLDVAHDRLVQLYDAWDKKDKADHWRHKERQLPDPS
jgi:eukaryotic-like serine/threonine-protein kinase